MFDTLRRFLPVELDPIGLHSIADLGEKHVIRIDHYGDGFSASRQVRQLARQNRIDMARAVRKNHISGIARAGGDLSVDVLTGFKSAKLDLGSWHARILESLRCGSGLTPTNNARPLSDKGFSAGLPGVLWPEEGGMISIVRRSR